MQVCLWAFRPLQKRARAIPVGLSHMSARSDVKELLSQWRKESGRWHVADSLMNQPGGRRQCKIYRIVTRERDS